MGIYRDLVHARPTDRVEIYESPLAALVNHRQPEAVPGTLVPVESPLPMQVNQVHSRLMGWTPAVADSPLAALVNRRDLGGTLSRWSDQSPLWLQVNSR